MSTDAKLLLEKPKRPETLEECWALVEKLYQIIHHLQERLNANSKNSSKPPSTDRKKKKKKVKSSQRKRGGQPGHVGVSRQLLPIEQVDQIVRCAPPTHCEDCQGTVVLTGGSIRHQVYEIPEPKFEVIEYQRLKGCCEICRKVMIGETPAEIGKRGFGVRTHAMIGLLTSKFKLSKRQALCLLKDFYQMPICVGSVSNVEHRVSEAIAPLHQEIKTHIDASAVAHIDETGFKQKNQSGWAWVMANEAFTFLYLATSRGKKVAKALIGHCINRTIISDRYPAYDYLPEKSHQVCWTHLKRDFQKIAERGGVVGAIGRQLLKHYGRIFGFWKSLQKSTYGFDRRTQKRCRHLKNGLRKALLRGTTCGQANTMRTCEKILAQGESLWLFLENKAIPATNNLAERQIRPLVIAKKLSFGVQSERGARFIERAYSVNLSCQQQDKNVLDWIQQSIRSYFIGCSPPTFAL